MGLDLFGVGEMASSAISLAGSVWQTDQSARMAGNQMDFQNAMFQKELDASSDAFQRRVVDLQKAGLNPMLAYTQGAASTPTGGAGAMGASPSNPGEAAVSGALEAYRTSAQVEKTRADTNASNTSAALNLALADKARQEKTTSAASADELTARAELQRQQISVAMSQVDKIASETDLNDAQRELAKQQVANAILSGRLIRTQTGVAEADKRLKELAIPQQSNVAGIQGSWYSRNVAPYLPDFLGGASAGAALTRALR